MEGRITCGLWLLVFLYGCGRLSAFNLDTDNVLQKNGEKDSLFGFSLAMHRQLQPVDKRMLVVGAPRAKALNGQKAKVTGGLYKCDMSSTSSSCTRVNFDNNEDLTRESKENQWMGVTVNSQGPGGKIVTCAHRYQRRSNVNTNIESRSIIGRCYVLSQDLTSDDGEEWHFCDGRHAGHEMFGSCQQGLSATFDKNYHYFIFGAPGAYNWKGVVRLEQRNYTLYDLGIFEDGPYEVGDQSDMNPDLVPVPPNSYLGFSLDSGMSLTKKGQLTVVAGAPRANHSGAVVLLKKGPDTKYILEEEYTLEGEGLASSFGYDLTVLDLNGDGWQDIVVGAPQYFEKEGTIGGAVYVYVNKNGNWNKATRTRIPGPQDSMFGQAVENLGDINQDGYHDFAVGAPYGDDGSGTVYIYHGSATGLKSEKAVQELSGKPLGARLFGYSLAGNMDLDKNFYPDLAVGSLSDSVFIYRARPVINIKKVIQFSPKEIDLTQKNCGNTFCLEVKACFSYTANPKNYSPRLTLAYSLEADAVLKKNGLNPRATFTPDNNYMSKGVITLDSKGKEQCVKRQLAVQENIRDKLRGIPVDVSVDIQDSTRKRRQSSNDQLTPILDDIEPKREIVNFLKEGCGKDNVCQSNLKLEYRYGHRSADGTFSPLELKNGMPVISLSDQKDIALQVTVTNLDGDDAHEAKVNASFPPSITYSAYRQDIQSNTGEVSCSANKDGSYATCDLGNPFKRSARVTFYIIVGTSRISLNTTELEIDLHLLTTSEQKIDPIKAKAKVTIVLQLSVTGQAQPSQVYFTKEVKASSTPLEAMKTESEIGSAITHQFRIINLGKRLTGLGTATLDIEWPKEVESGKLLLYLMKISSTGVDQIGCTPKDVINTLKKEASNTRTRRSTENTKGIEEGSLSRLIDKRTSKILSCDDGAKCVKIRCPLQGLDSNAVFTLKSRLSNTTLLQDYSSFPYLEVIVKASLHVDGTSKNTVLKNAETQVRLTVFPERHSAQYGGVPWWIIVLSILLGLLLLGLLAFLLWKCGFFKRAKYEEKVPSYNAVRIKREERAVNPGSGKWENLEKKPWMTTWHDNEHYS